MKVGDRLGEDTACCFHKSAKTPKIQQCLFCHTLKSRCHQPRRILGYVSKQRHFCCGMGFTFAVCLHFLFVLLGLFAIPRTFITCGLVPYLAALCYKRDETKTGAPWPFFSKNFVAFTCLRECLQLEFAPIPEKLIKSASSKEAQFIFAAFPHGTSSDYHRILMDGMLPAVLPSIANKVRVLTASIIFRLPLVREIALWTSCVDAQKAVAERLVDKKYSLFVLPGGMDEQIMTEHQKEKIFLKNRKGFIRLALQKGVHVVPVYVFGTSDHYTTSSAWFGVRHWVMKNLRVCIPLARGLWGSACPLPVKTTVVMGEPLEFSTPASGGQPTQEEIDKAHSLFVKAVVTLFNEHKEKFGCANRQLIVC